MKKLLLMKTMLLLCALIAGSGTMWADDVLYSENFGNPASNTNISSYSGWSATSSMFNLTGAETVASCYSGNKVGSGNASTSSDYSAASGQGNAYQGGTAGTTTTILTVQKIKITGKSNLSLIFAIYNGAAAKYVDAYYQIDSGSETKLTLTGYGASSGWQYVSASIPGTGTNLKLIFKHTPTKAWTTRIDDIKLTGVAAAPEAPTFDPAEGDFSEAFTLHLASATDGATIYYEKTTDGSTPDDPTSLSTEYVPASGISISAGSTVKIKAIAIKDDVSSDVSSATYTYKNIANPLFTPADGSTLLYGESVTLSCATPGAKIYYTQGSTPADPTSASTEYTTPIVLTAGTTIKAIAINGGDESDVVSATYTVKATAPTFSVAAGSYDATQSVELSTTTEGATIYYTTDGSTPTNESTEYTGAISVSATQTIKAIAIKTGLTNSDVASATYTLKCATPIFSVTPGIYDATQSVELSSTAGATIYYTIKTDGTTPANPTSSSTEYTGAISVSSSAIIKAIAIKDGMTNSDITTAAYRIVVPAELPFKWVGGVKADLIAKQGVETSGLGSGYGDTHEPYRVQFDNTGDYIQVRTNGPIAKVYVGVKMVGGSSTSKIKVKGSANGTDFIDVQELTISGASNAILSLETTNAFSSTYNWVRLEFVKGSNVGVGPITITPIVPVTITSAEYATYCNASNALDFSETGITAYTATDETTYVKLHEITSGQVPANTPVVLYKAGADGTAINVPGIASAAAVGDNDLKVVGTGGISGVVNMYVLAKKSDIVGFYLWDKTKTLNEGKIYLDASGAGSRSFLGLGDETTGISNLTPALSEGEGAVYDLQGRKVAQPTKGLYIVNGRKVVLK